ncbi:seminal metalloprotease 1-like [Haematobia irritans]|uniref:seminal metalloprotease 1-like n=1 Tax=Haematobia irritans TaxID=7368 RepID=UPI003F508851
MRYFSSWTILLAICLLMLIISNTTSAKRRKGARRPRKPKLRRTRKAQKLQKSQSGIQPWPKGEVPYKISDIYDDSEADAIETALDTIASVSCVQFYEASNTTTSYIYFDSTKSGCFTRVGYRGGVHLVNIYKNATACFNQPKVIHETMHALGFCHQHLAKNRDDYITVLWDNIQPDKRVFFEKDIKGRCPTFGVGYDVNSVMHYKRLAFSSNGLPTIEGKNVTAVGNRVGLSEKDIQKLNILYQCAEEIPDDEETTTTIPDTSTVETETV